MGTFVLCHGGWAGGGQWREVASLLRAAGHEIFTPTVTGLGERVHLAHPDIDRNTYIQDILMVLKYEDLRDAVLLGYSISGPVITGVAEEAAEKIDQLGHLDAYLLNDGQSLADLVGPEITAGLEQVAKEYGECGNQSGISGVRKRTWHKCRSGQRAQLANTFGRWRRKWKPSAPRRRECQASEPWLRRATR